LNIVIMLGYGMIDCLVGGQFLSAVADGKVTIIMSVFQIYERYGKPYAPLSIYDWC
jgi:hypothetical protein